MEHTLVDLDSRNGAFDEAIRQVVAQGREQVDLAKKALSCLTFATRRLTVSELREALAIKAGDSQTDPDNRPEIADIISACCGLAVLQDYPNTGFVDLVHHTVREYLGSAREPQFPENEIGVACVRYLSMAEFERGACSSDEELEQRLRSRPFHEYAAQNWGRHFVTPFHPPRKFSTSSPAGRN